MFQHTTNYANTSKNGGAFFIVIIPEHDLVALSEDQQSFADISEHELEHCTKVPSSRSTHILLIRDGGLVK